jgi:hypothetical protein
MSQFFMEANSIFEFFFWEFFEKELESGLRGYDTELTRVHAIENSVVTIQKSLVAAGRSSWNRRQFDPDAYHLAIKAYDKAFRATKRTSWSTFCGQLNCIISSARLHRVLSKDVRYQVGALRFLSGDFTSSDKEATEHLLMTHFLGCQPNASEVVSEGKVRLLMVLVPLRGGSMGLKLSYRMVTFRLQGAQ